MSTATKWRIGIALALLLALMIGVARRCGSPDPTRDARLLPEVAATSNAERSERERVELQERLAAGRSTITVRVDVVPAGSELEWHADLYLLATRHRDRSRLAAETRRGAGALTWEVPGDKLGVHVWSDDGVGGSWTELETTTATPGDVRVELRAYGRLAGTVTDAEGQPVAGARVVFVPTSDTASRGEHPPFEGRRGEEVDGSLTCESDAAGRYALARVDPRTSYDGAAAAPGHAVRRELGVAAGAGAETAQDFRLDVASQIRGRLLDAAGQPIAGAHLRLATPRDPDEEAGIAWDAEGEAVTGPDGGFLFDCLTPGWKKVQAVLAAEIGVSVVGHWECRLGRDEARDMGDLLVRDSLLEVTIATPEGERGSYRVRFGFVPASGSGGDQGALLVVPVAPDDDGVFRVRGLPPGEIHAVVDDRTPRDDGRWRSRTDVEQRFDGASEHVEWMLVPLRDGTRTVRDEHGRQLVNIQLELPEGGDDALALLFVEGELQTIQTASTTSISVAAAPGDRVRLVVTEGGRWGQHEHVVEGAARLRPEIRADRPGNSLEIRVRDDGRPVAGAMVLLGSDPEMLFPLRVTGQDGRIVLGGVPPDVALFVSAMAFRDQPEPQAVVWSGGRARIDVDMGGD